MLSKNNKRSEVELKLCKSRETEKLYYGLFENGNPVKYWDYELISEAGHDLIKEIFSAFDLGYDIRCQFPKIDKQGNKHIEPEIIRMYNEPGSKKSNPKIKEEFFSNSDIE